MRINNDFKITNDIISHKTKKTKLKKGENKKIVLGFVQKDNIKYLKIENNQDKIIMKIEGNSIEISLVSNKNIDQKKLSNLIKKLGWNVSIKQYNKNNDSK